MLRLDAITRKLQAVLAGAIATSQLPIMVAYSDKTTTAYTGAAQVTNTNSTTAVDICNSPAASTVRDVDYLSVRNSDTAVATVTIRYNDNAVLYTIVTAVLAVGDHLVYVHGDGWKVLDTNGQTKTTALSGLTAVNVTNAPAGSISAINVQAALNELDTEKAALAGATFTGPVTTTGLGSPTLTGGTTTTSDLFLKTTSGVGAAGADMHFLVGNNGATEAMTVLNNGNVGVGTTAPSTKFSVGSLAGEDSYLFFDNANISDAVDGQSLYIYRRAAEGDDYIRFYTNQYREGQLRTSGTLYFLSGASMYFEPAGTTNLAYRGPGDSTFFLNAPAGTNRQLIVWGYPAAAAAANYASFQIIGANHDLEIKSNNALGDIILSPGTTSGNVGVGTPNPTARIHITAGSATANTAPLKLTSGALNTTAEVGAVEFLTDKYYTVITTGAARKEITLNDAALTSGRVPFATTNGRLTDDADLTFSGDTLTAASLRSTNPLQQIITGAAAVAGNATLVAGTVTVSTTAVKTASIVMLTRKTSGGTIGTAITYTISNGVSFTINSDNVLDTSTFSWLIVDTY